MTTPCFINSNCGMPITMMPTPEFFYSVFIPLLFQSILIVAAILTPVFIYKYFSEWKKPERGEGATKGSTIKT